MFRDYATNDALLSQIKALHASNILLLMHFIGGRHHWDIILFDVSDKNLILNSDYFRAPDDNRLYCIPELWRPSNARINDNIEADYW